MGDQRRQCVLLFHLEREGGEGGGLETEKIGGSATPESASELDVGIHTVGSRLMLGSLIAALGYRSWLRLLVQYLVSFIAPAAGA